MKSYLVITKDRETGEVEIRAKLLPYETLQLATIRGFLVWQITDLLDSECKRLVFKRE